MNHSNGDKPEHWKSDACTRLYIKKVKIDMWRMRKHSMKEKLKCSQWHFSALPNCVSESYENCKTQPLLLQSHY